MIALLNLGNSNIQSVVNALDHIGANHFITDQYDELSKCDRIILPGVGNFGDGVSRLKQLNLFDAIKKEVLINNKQILGICLGMQILFDNSEECVGAEGLGLIKGSIVKLPKSENYHIPRVGWADSYLNNDFLGLDKASEHDFYYIHSYYAKPVDPSVVSIETEDNITSAVQHNRVYGCQFHPEKSHLAGLTILKTFAGLNGGFR